MSKETIRIHPENSKIFEFRGKPLVLVCGTEHYGSVMNRPFRFERYLADARDKSQTLTRLFTLFREMQSPVNPYSPCKPESPDYITPFLRVGPGRAQDSLPQYDLNQWNPEFFDRLHRFVSLASQYGIIVEVVPFSNTYDETLWGLNPMYPKNNINGLSDIVFADYNSLRNEQLFEWQSRYTRKLVEELNPYENIFYEICNEPVSQILVDSKAPTRDEINAWQVAIADLIRQTESDLPNRHLVAGAEAWNMHEDINVFMQQVEGVEVQPSDFAFGDYPVDIVNIHPLPNTTYNGGSYDLGAFMMKQLRLRPLRDYCLDSYHEVKPLNMDEDNVATQFKDFDGWTIHRKRAWVTLLSGAHYDFIDFSIINYCETGTEQSQCHIRTWIKHLSDYVHALDLVNARPLTDIVKNLPPHTLDSVFGIAGKDVTIYLADERELEDPRCGEEIQGELEINLPQGTYKLACFSPQTGLYSPWTTQEGSPKTVIQLPAFEHDIVVRIATAD